MPIPTPRPDEGKDAFISRCISALSHVDPNRPRDQVIGICYGQWDKKSKQAEVAETKEEKSTRPQQSDKIIQKQEMDSFLKQQKERKTEVKAQNEKFNCQCIKCGYKIQSVKHCVELKCPKCNRQMRRAERPGPGQE